MSVPPSARPVESFVAFADRQFRPLTGLAYSLCGDSHTAAEIAQDALLAAHSRWETVSVMDKPEAWVKRVVANRAVSVVRRRAVEARAMLRLGSRREPEPAVVVDAETDWLWALVRSLPRRQRQVVALRFVDRLTLDEIAGVLKISKASANTHLRRALETLAGQIDEEDR